MTVVAIDGPGGSGKSTVAAALAARLGVDLLDTGAMYRALTLEALRRSVAIGDAPALGMLAREIDLDVCCGPSGTTVLLAGEDVSQAVRSAEVDAVVSVVAAHSAVRRELVERQRAWVASRGSAVVEGRDIASVVLPDADLKVYLTADPAERARRRAGEIAGDVPRARAGSAGSSGVDDVVARADASIARRDQIDATRLDSPIVVADGAVVVDSTGLAADEVVDEIRALL
jgi:cytidylate kinase